MDSRQTHPPHHPSSPPHHPSSPPRPAPSLQGPIAPDRQRSLNWRLILGLGLLALARPITSTVLDQIGVDLGPVVPLGWTAIISLIWISAVGMTRTVSPMVTLVLTGLVYGASAIVLSAVLSPILLGELQGPLVNPVGAVSMLVTNVLWGLIAGALALALQRVRGIRAGSVPAQS